MASDGGGYFSGLFDSVSQGDLDLISGIGAGISAYSQMEAADMQAEIREEQLKAKQAQVEVQEQEAALQAQQKQNRINERLADQLEKIRSAQSTSNVVMGSGSKQDVRSGMRGDARETKQRIDQNLRLRQLRREAQRKALEDRADFEPDFLAESGKIGAMQGLTQFGLNMARRKVNNREARENIGGPATNE